MRVLVLTIDGLQPAYLGPYGCEWVPTPALDRWAAVGVVFDQHFSDHPDPAAARAAWRSGRPQLPRVTPASGDSGGAPDLPSDLRNAGIRTARVGPPLSADSPFAAGWDIDLPAGRDADDPCGLKPTRRAVRQTIERLSDAPNALLWVEIDALLPPWRPSDEAIAEFFADEPDEDEAEAVDEAGASETPPPEPLEPWTDPLPDRIAPDDDRTFERLQRTYAAAVASFDAGLEGLLKDCTKRGWGDEAVWLLTSERGFPLGEHGPVGFAAADLHEELVHLPLMLRWPHAEHAGLRTSALTQPADLAPTLRELFGLLAPGGEEGQSGKSLVGLARGEDGPLRDRLINGRRVGERELWGLRTAEWYLLLDDSGAEETRRLFAKPEDRWEVNDIRPRRLELAEELEQELWRRIGSRDQSV